MNDLSLSVGFDQAGRWFVFGANGKTLVKGLRSKALALGYIAQRTEDARKATPRPSAEHTHENTSERL
jgi:hypothetical protein